MTCQADSSPVLVVDDDIEIRHALRELLQDEGYIVIVAANGREALEIVRSGLALRLVILDIMMPVMDGREFLEQVQSLPCYGALRVVVATANRELSSIPGGFPLIAKPFDIDVILNAVHDPPLPRATSTGQQLKRGCP